MVKYTREQIEQMKIEFSIDPNSKPVPLPTPIYQQSVQPRYQQSVQPRQVAGIKSDTILKYSDEDLTAIPDELTKYLYPNLQRLYIYNNQISQIQGLDSLTNLQRLDLDSNSIKWWKNRKAIKALKARGVTVSV